MGLLEPILDTIDGFFAWSSSNLGAGSETYCELETADSKTSLVARDGSLVSLIKISGAKYLVGPEEFQKIHDEMTSVFQSSLARPGHALQMYYVYDKTNIRQDLRRILNPAIKTAERLEMKLDDLFNERVENLSGYCAQEGFYLVLWTRPTILTKEQFEQANKDREEMMKNAKIKIPAIRNAQNIIRGIPEIRDGHESYTTAVLAQLNGLSFDCELLTIHKACHAIRYSVDANFTDEHWQATLPGDKIPLRSTKHFEGEISEVLWPSLAKQLIPRDGENLDLRFARVGDFIYGSVFVELLPKETAPFIQLFSKLLPLGIPWRMSMMIESDGMRTLGMKPMLASFLSFASNNNKLINGAMNVLNHMKDNTDEALVRIKICLSTWALDTEEKLIRSRVSELAKAVQGWGYTETAEISGDPFGGALGSALGIGSDNHATATVAPLTNVMYMFPWTRPSSPWAKGAVMFRSPDGKPWAYQPGSSLQTTWIDIVYARPGSGKSVLSNSINLALALSPGIQRLPRIAIVDIGPSSSGLVSLLKEALPESQRHLVAYHRLRMVNEMSINPFDTQLGCRRPTPLERAFLVNFVTLLATPVGSSHPYDGITDMAGLIVDEMYTTLADEGNGNPHPYSPNLEPEIDAKVNELGIEFDSKTSWWEITDELFKHGEMHIANKAQRHAMPLLADAASICRSPNIEDLYGDIKAPTGEPLIGAFGRMISAAVREYPILSQITAFDLGDSRIVSLDLDEVAKTGGEAADRQTAIMYMLARYVLARHYYLTEDNVSDMPALYQEHQRKRILEIREDPKRIIFDEFHRTSKAQAVRDQVLVDMREGRKWKVQVALLSQSLDDFDPVMIEFATAIFIMDAGPKQAIEKSCKVFGLSDTAKLALTNRVHGPRAGGATFLAQFATKSGINTQLLTSTIGPIELWAFNTTAEDARIRNALYQEIGAAETRRLLAYMYPSGSAAQDIEDRLAKLSEGTVTVDKEQQQGVVQEVIDECLEYYKEKFVRGR